MDMNSSPRPAPRPVTTDLPYGIVDRIDDVIAKVSDGSGVGAEAIAGTGSIVVLLIGVIALIVLVLKTPSTGKKTRNANPGFREVAGIRPISPATPPLRAPSKAQSSSPRYPIRRLPVFPVSGELSGKCHVIDGDTIVIKRTKIRLAGIDAPELDKPFGQKSKWEMVNICKGQVITAKLNGERSHDRLVGTCHLPDGSDIGAELISRGLALDWAMFSGGRYRHLEPPGVRNRLMWVRHNI
jgi:endonuclease YncB( thermonuclease family)